MENDRPIVVEDDQLETRTGKMRRNEAMLQIAAIPFAILLGFVLLVLGWTFS